MNNHNTWGGLLCGWDSDKKRVDFWLRQNPFCDNSQRVGQRTHLKWWIRKKKNSPWLKQTHTHTKKWNAAAASEDCKYGGTDAIIHCVFTLCVLMDGVYSLSLSLSQRFLLLPGKHLSLHSSRVQQVAHTVFVWACVFVFASRCNCHQCHFHLGVLLFTLSNALKIQKEFNSLFCSQWHPKRAT